MKPNLQDANFEQSAAIPTGATPSAIAGFDLGQSDRGEFLAQCELVIQAPALVVGSLPNAHTVTYAIQASDDPTWANGTAAPTRTVADKVLVQTGASGAGAAAAEARFRFPTDIERYVRVAATGSASAAPSAQETFAAGIRF